MYPSSVLESVQAVLVETSTAKYKTHEQQQGCLLTARSENQCHSQLFSVALQISSAKERLKDTTTNRLKFSHNVLLFKMLVKSHPGGRGSRSSPDRPDRTVLYRPQLHPEDRLSGWPVS